jgi:hypothetical protein
VSTTAVIVTVVVIVLVLLVLALVVASTRKRRSAQLRDEFGPEYDRTVDDAGKRRHAEKELQSRKEEHEQLELRPLTPSAQQRFTEAWKGVQTRFVDTPALALSEADTLVTQLLDERGYPIGDFDTSARLLSVEHSHVLDSYRSAHAVEVSSRSRTADTETVRNAFLDFRSVFEDVMAEATRESDSTGAQEDPYPATDEPQVTRQRRSTRS